MAVRDRKKPVVSAETAVALRRVAQAISVYQGVKLETYRPANKKTLVYDAWNSGNLSKRHQQAWTWTYDLFQGAAGTSPQNMFSAASGSRQGGGTAVTLRGGCNAAQTRLEWLRDHYLHHHEWKLLVLLMSDMIQAGRLVRLDELGAALSGYATAQGRSAGVSAIQRLLESLCEFHGI